MGTVNTPVRTVYCKHKGVKFYSFKTPKGVCIQKRNALNAPSTVKQFHQFRLIFAIDSETISGISVLSTQQSNDALVELKSNRNQVIKRSFGCD